MKVIGITGGVGSGKSTISEILKDKYNAYLINTDQIAHELMQKGNVSYNLIVDHFGKDILDMDGNISRSLLGAIVYKDPTELIKLNSFSHPYVMARVKGIIEQKNSEHVNIVSVETALPKEAKLNEICDEVWYIYAPEEVRRERLTASRNYTEEKIRHIFKNQLADEDYLKLSNYKINTHNSMDKIIEQIKFIIEK